MILQGGLHASTVADGQPATVDHGSQALPLGWAGACRRVLVACPRGFRKAGLGWRHAPRPHITMPNGACTDGPKNTPPAACRLFGRVPFTGGRRLGAARPNRAQSCRQTGLLFPLDDPARALRPVLLHARRRQVPT
jgi:hypothetical protein